MEKLLDAVHSVLPSSRDVQKMFRQVRNEGDPVLSKAKGFSSSERLLARGKLEVTGTFGRRSLCAEVSFSIGNLLF